MHNSSIKIISSDPNNYIVEITNTAQDKQAQVMGISNRQCAKSDNIQATYNDAINNAYTTISNLPYSTAINPQESLCTLETSKPLPISTETFSEKDNNKNDKLYAPGGGNKPISDKQIVLIQRLGKEQKLDINALIHGRYDKKEINQLNGTEADDMIKSLKK